MSFVWSMTPLVITEKLLRQIRSYSSTERRFCNPHFFVESLFVYVYRKLVPNFFLLCGFSFFLFYEPLRQVLMLVPNFLDTLLPSFLRKCFSWNHKNSSLFLCFSLQKSGYTKCENFPTWKQPDSSYLFTWKNNYKRALISSFYLSLATSTNIFYK